MNGGRSGAEVEWSSEARSPSGSVRTPSDQGDSMSGLRIPSAIPSLARNLTKKGNIDFRKFKILYKNHIK